MNMKIILWKTFFTLNLYPNSDITLMMKIKSFILSSFILSSGLFLSLSILNIYNFSHLFSDIETYQHFCFFIVFLFIFSLVSLLITNKNPFKLFFFILLFPILRLKSKDISKNFQQLYIIFKEYDKEDVLEKTYNSLLKLEKKEPFNFRLSGFDIFFYILKKHVLKKKSDKINQVSYEDLKRKNITSSDTLEQDITFFKEENEKETSLKAN